MKRVPILMYHWFKRDKGPASRSPQLEISNDLFEQHLKFLREKEYNTIHLGQLFNEGALPKKPVIITFDDGTADFLEHGRPLLQKYNFTSTLFVVTDYIGKSSTWDADCGEPARPLMDWQQIVELHKNGFEIASHSHTHRQFTNLSDAEITQELALSKRILEDRLNNSIKFFAYPRGQFYDTHKFLVEKSGYIAAVAVVLNWKDMLNNDRYSLPRITIKGTETLATFKWRLEAAKICGFKGGQTV